MDKQSKRHEDENGYWLSADTPISKVGVYPYLGAELPDYLGLQPNKVYNVYRSADALSDPECIDSFLGVPFIDDHTWLGNHGMPAEQKGVQGVVLSKPYFENPYLKSDIKIYSRALQNKIKNGKKELSPGYRAEYKLESGNFNGQSYDIVQYNLRGNHLALVAQGRTGPDVAVQDHQSFTLDTMEFIPMDFTPEQMEQLRTMIAEIVAMQLTDAAVAAENKLMEQKETTEDAEGDLETTPEKISKGVELDATEANNIVQSTAEVKEIMQEAVSALAEVEAASAAVEEAAKTGNTADTNAALKKHKKALDKYKAALLSKTNKVQDAAVISELKSEITNLKKLVQANTIDAASISGQIAKRDDLANRLSHQFGTFDHQLMSLSDVAKYGLNKAKIKPVEGAEVAMIESYLKDRKSDDIAKTHDQKIKPVTTLEAIWDAQAKKGGN